MDKHHSSHRYSKPAIVLHWTIFIAVAITYLAIDIRGPKGSSGRDYWTHVHFWAGSTVLGLAIVRLAWRLWAGTPEEISASRMQHFLCRLTHLSLYVFIFAQPVLGLLLLNTAGYPVTLPLLGVDIWLVGPDPLAKPWIKGAHELIGNLFYAVIGLHALAAIFHHVILKDATLRRML